MKQNLRKKSHICAAVSLLALAVLLLGAVTSASALSEEETQLLVGKMVERINQDRAEAGLDPVELDELASQVATAHCQEMLEGGYFSHWNGQGLKPYHRYSLAGGTHYNAENLYEYETTGTLDTSLGGIAKILFLGHQGFMDEGPEGGHRKNILDPFHTHVGIGFAFSNNSLRMAQEFLNKYVSLTEAPKKATRDEKVSIEGRMLFDTELPSVTVFYEPPPVQMTLGELSKTGAYSLGNDEAPTVYITTTGTNYHNPLCRYLGGSGIPLALSKARAEGYTPCRVCNPPTSEGDRVSRKDLFPLLPPGWHYSDGGKGDVKLMEDGTFSFPVPFFAGAGVYTVVVWVRSPTEDPAPATSFSLFVTEE